MENLVNTEEKQFKVNGSYILRIFNFENQTQRINLFKDDIKDLLLNKKVYVKSINPLCNYDEILGCSAAKPVKIITISATCELNKQLYESFIFTKELKEKKHLFQTHVQLDLDPYQCQNSVRNTKIDSSDTESAYSNLSEEDTSVFDKNFYIEMSILPYSDMVLALTFVR